MIAVVEATPSEIDALVDLEAALLLEDAVNRHQREWTVDMVTGVTVGGIGGAIVSVNGVIYAGPDAGFESAPGDVFDHSPLALAAVIAGPIQGVAIAANPQPTRGAAGGGTAVGVPAADRRRSSTGRITSGVSSPSPGWMTSAP